jgi:hypothetical protein
MSEDLLTLIEDAEWPAGGGTDTELKVVDWGDGEPKSVWLCLRADYDGSSSLSMTAAEARHLAAKLVEAAEFLERLEPRP